MVSRQGLTHTIYGLQPMTGFQAIVSSFGQPAEDSVDWLRRMQTGNLAIAHGHSYSS
jgi:hypothetical protein